MLASQSTHKMRGLVGREKIVLFLKIGLHIMFVIKTIRRWNAVRPHINLTKTVRKIDDRAGGVT